VVVEGAQSPDEKADKLLGFQDGTHRVLITKPSIAGFGLNFQHCARMAFMGIGDSYEQYYQAIRRCWRYGQAKPVSAFVVVSGPEQHIYTNVLRKEREATDAAEQMVRHVAEYEREEIMEHDADKFTYATIDESGDGWEFKLGDSCERLAEIEDDSIGLSIFSPPFESLYTYSPTERDLGNSASSGEFWTHFEWISSQLLRTLKPGRLAAVHVQQLPTTKTVEGFIGMRDFRGATIAHFIEQGFIYHGEICIDKDPQAQAIRTKAKSLMFVQLHKDSSWMRPAFADYILLFRKPGDNPEPIVNDWVSNEDWISWARPIWYSIRESDTLNVAEARSRDDERHIAPLQLETIRRAVLLWSNPGDKILSPFGGIGSEGYVAVRNGREFVGVELKPEYFRVGVRNLRRAERERDSGTLLDLIVDAEDDQ
jgi:DNA modification methylase